MADDNPFKGWSYEELLEEWGIEYEWDTAVETLTGYIDERRGIHDPKLDDESDFNEWLNILNDVQLFLYKLADEEEGIGFKGPAFRGIADVYQPDAGCWWDVLGSGDTMIKLFIPLIDQAWS